MHHLLLKKGWGGDPQHTAQNTQACLPAYARTHLDPVHEPPGGATLLGQLQHRPPGPVLHRRVRAYVFEHGVKGNAVSPLYGSDGRFGCCCRLDPSHAHACARTFLDEHGQGLPALGVRRQEQGGAPPVVLVFGADARFEQVGGARVAEEEVRDVRVAVLGELGGGGRVGGVRRPWMDGCLRFSLSLRTHRTATEDHEGRKRKEERGGNAPGVGGDHQGRAAVVRRDGGVRPLGQERRHAGDIVREVARPVSWFCFDRRRLG